jgi:hypothetical protein
MTEDPVEDNLELQVVRAAEPFDASFRRELPQTGCCCVCNLRESVGGRGTGPGGLSC